MQNNFVLDSLNQIFPPSTVALLLRSLRQDKVIWSALQDPTFWSAVSSTCVDRLQAWNPGQIGLLVLMNDGVDPTICPPTVESLSPEAVAAALKAYERAGEGGSFPLDLRGHALLALAFWERRRRKGSWRGLGEELTRLSGAAGAFQTWKTSLAILSGWIEDRSQCFDALFEGAEWFTAMRWVGHALLSMPLENPQRIETLSTYLFPQSLDHRLEFLAWLQEQGLDSLARVLADNLTEDLNLLPEEQTLSGKNLIASELNRAEHFRKTGNILQIAGKLVEADYMMQEAQKCLEHVTHAVSLKTGKLGRVRGLDVIQPLAAVMSADHGEDDETAPAVSIPVLLVEIDATLRQGLEDESRQAGQKLYQLIQSSGGKAVSLADFNAVIDPGEVIGTLLRLGLNQEAYDTARLFLDSRPGDCEVLSIFADTCLKINRYEEALHALQMGASLEPENLDWRRNLARVYHLCGDLQASFEERKAIVRAAGPLSAGDQLALAEAALAVSDAGEALLACNQVLAEDAENGLALALRGKSQVLLGNYKDAENDLSRAALYQPDHEVAWLALADLYEEMGAEQKKVEVLREAAMACPQSGAVAFRLAEVYLAKGQAAEALPYLRQASHLQADNPTAALELARTLRLIGRLDEAAGIAAAAVQSWPRNMDLVRLFGEILFESGKREQAAAYLRLANEADPAAADLAVMLAAALLNAAADPVFLEEGEIERKNLAPARDALVKALVHHPDHFNASYMLAEIERLDGKASIALKIYRHLLELPEAHQDRWRWRIQTGLGRSALRAGELEVALAALADAAADCPNNPGVQQMLAEAYLQSQLPQEAVNVAGELLRQQPDDLETVLWYGKVMEQTGRKAEEMNALLHALDINPTSPDLRLRAADKQMAGGAVKEALDTLQPLLGLEDAGAEHWAMAADLFIAGSDETAAAECLCRGIQASLEPRRDLYLKLAALLEKQGDFSSARQILSGLLENFPEDAAGMVLYAFLAHQAGDHPAALKTLERFRRLNIPAVENIDDGVRKYFSDRAAQLLQTSGGLDRLALDCNLAAGNLGGALTDLERLTASHPEDDTLAAMRIELRCRLLLEPYAENSARQPGSGDLQGFSRFCAAAAEAALLTGDLETAQKVLAAGRSGGNTARLAAVEVRCLAREGKVSQSHQLLESLVNDLTGKDAEPALINQEIWLGLACLEAGSWDLAFRLLSAQAERQPADSLAQLALAQASVLAAEYCLLADELKIQTHRPAGSSASFAKIFENAMLALASKNSNRDVQRWRYRGQTVFQPGTATIRALALMQPDVSDIAAVVGALRRMGNTKTAVEAALRFPNHPATLIQLGLACMEADPDRGLAFAIQAVEREPENPILRAAAALLAERNFQEDLALDLLESALEIWPEEPEWQSWAGQLAAHLKEHDTAILHFSKASQLDPDNPAILNSLGAELAAAAEYEKAETALEAACVLQPENSDALLTLAGVKLKLSKHADGLRLAQNAGNLNPKATRPLILQGEIAFAQGKLDAACEFAAAALALDPQDLNAVLFSSRVEQALGNPLAAAEALDRYLQLHPGAFPAILEKARIVYQNQGAHRAVQTIKAIDRSDLHDREAFEFISRLLAETGDFPAAIDICQRALGLYPNDVEIRVRLAALLRKNGDLDQALHEYTEVIRLNPEALEPYLCLADIYRQQRQPGLALKTLQAAIAVSGSDPRPYLQAAELLRDGKEYAAAESMLRRASQLAPDDVEIRRQLGALIALNLVHHSQEASAL